MLTNNFSKRQIGTIETDTDLQLNAVGVNSLDDLLAKTLPDAIRLKNDLDLPKGLNEFEYLNHLKALCQKNKIFRSFIGQGYYGSITPAVIQRNVFENPGWYTAYTPYQAEISQGRLEALLIFQTVISDMTGMPIANCSLLDEATAASEAMLMLYRSRSREKQKNDANIFFADKNLFPQTLEVLKNRANPLGIDIIVADFENFKFSDKVFGTIVQYPNQYGEIHDYHNFVEKAHSNGVFVAVAADLLSLALLTPPAEWDADCVVGSNQRFGLPVGFGGPHAGYFACKEDFKRQMPGRIIGVSVDKFGNRALRMALGMREQHIKREKATSNICTASALMAIMSGFYAVYHGKEGLKTIAQKIYTMAHILSIEIEKYGYKNLNTNYFDTLFIELPAFAEIANIIALSNEYGINFRIIDEKHIGISLDETTSKEDIEKILSVFGGKHICGVHCGNIAALPENISRSSDFLTQTIFKKYHSETAIMRFIKALEIKDLSLNRAMIPLGSCTMKLNAAVEMFCLSMPEFANIHPFVPQEQAVGYLEMIAEMEKYFCEITGFAAISFQPNSGAAGEYAGLLVIRNFFIANNSHRNIVLIPASAHGTNPASAAMAGFDIITVASTENGEINIEDLRQKAIENKDNLACLMVTYPSTHGVFEASILEIINIIHENGGLVYMDGANMNAQVGLTSPGYMGADVCHLNLHKTFGMPHGGGGPGIGPICVSEKLKKFLPSIIIRNKEQGTKTNLQPYNHSGAVASAPFGNASLLPISYGYLKLLGKDGLKNATIYAILNANYLLKKLAPHYKILYTNPLGFCAHEFILDCNEFDKSANIQVGDIAKRLMDYGFHAPTVAFPVHGTLMVEPTESEDLAELDRLVTAFIAIRQEIRDIEEGKSDKLNNPLKNAPHTQEVVCSDEWKHPYSRKQAAFPLPHSDKYWATVSRIDDAFGDRNLVCKL
ncbi:MAG: aminomethyl-transferring glycine dehydrogenase [Bacteroidales bacterium]|jgi:glycine dehydrogenase|nr:aminomethyl-transferring glycine dehydrogenase [Bacteroidales bacterium]